MSGIWLLNIQIFQLQLKSHLRGKWANMVIKDLKEVRMSFSFAEIKLMKPQQFKSILKDKIRNRAFQYLIGKINQKGKQINYRKLQTAEYLLPNDYLNIDEQKLVFSLRSESFRVSENYDNTVKLCICQDKLTLEHIYCCKTLNDDNQPVEYIKIYNGTVKEMKIVASRFRKSWSSYTCKTRQDLSKVDPTSSK